MYSAYITTNYLHDDYSSVVDYMYSIDKSGKINLSIKKALKEERGNNVSAAHVRPADIDWSAKNNEELSFEDKLQRFKKDSEERMLALKLSNDSKRSGGYQRLTKGR